MSYYTAIEKQRPINEYFVSDSPATVKVYVGKKRKLWVLPEDILCDRVSYFKAAFKGNFKEGVEKEVYLEEDCPTAFATIIDYLFGKQLDHYTDEAESVSQLWWCKLFVLSDKLDIAPLKAAILRSYSIIFCSHAQYISDRKSKAPEPEAVLYTYENTAPGSELRTMLVGQAVSFFVAHVCQFPGQDCGKEDLDAYVKATTCDDEFNTDATKGLAVHIADGYASCMQVNCKAHVPLSRPLGYSALNDSD